MMVSMPLQGLPCNSLHACPAVSATRNKGQVIVFGILRRRSETVFLISAGCQKSTQCCSISRHDSGSLKWLQELSSIANYWPFSYLNISCINRDQGRLIGGSVSEQTVQRAARRAEEPEASVQMFATGRNQRISHLPSRAQLIIYAAAQDVCH